MVNDPEKDLLRALDNPLMFYTNHAEFESIKDDVDSMDAPIFGLSDDKNPRVYDIKGGTRISVLPSGSGAATLMDKDVWIYAITAIIHRLENGLEVSPNVLISGSDFMALTKRARAGRYYDQLEKSLDRLSGTRIKIESFGDVLDGGNRRYTISFPLIAGYKMVNDVFPDRRKNRFNVMVRLPDEVYAAVLESRILSIDESYFDIKRPLDRRVYELARKHCGSQREWKIKIKNLREKTGSIRDLKHFKSDIVRIVKEDSLPDYSIELTKSVEGSDMLIFRSRDVKKYVKFEGDF